MPKLSNSELRVVVFAERGMWVGQCLEYDICSQASSLLSLRNRMRALIWVEREFGDVEADGPFYGIQPAPMHFNEMWNQGLAIHDMPNWRAFGSPPACHGAS
jgi:hypothetical protein